MIYLECYADMALVMSLGIAGKDTEHAYNKGNVCRKLKKASNARGLVDEDPFSAQPGYIKELKTVSQEQDVRVFEDARSGNKLIVLRPRLEEWLLETAKQANVNIEDCGLPDDLEGFRSVLGISDRLKHNLDRMKKLTQAIMRGKSPRMRILRDSLMA